MWFRVVLVFLPGRGVLLRNPDFTIYFISFRRFLFAELCCSSPAIGPVEIVSCRELLAGTSCSEVIPVWRLFLPAGCPLPPDRAIFRSASPEGFPVLAAAPVCGRLGRFPVVFTPFLSLPVGPVPEPHDHWHAKIILFSKFHRHPPLRTIKTLCGDFSQHCRGPVWASSMRSVFHVAQAVGSIVKARKDKGDTKDPDLTREQQKYEVERSKQTAALEEQNVIGKRIANQIARMDELLASETLNFKVELAEEQVNKIRKETEVLNGQLIKLRDEHAREPAIVKEINSRIYLNNMNAALAEVRKRLTEKEITTEGQEFFLKLAQTSNFKEATEVLKDKQREFDLKLPGLEFERELNDPSTFGEIGRLAKLLFGFIGQLLQAAIPLKGILGK